MTELQPPVAPQRHHEFDLFNDARTDPWFWLRFIEDAETMAYLEAENAYTDAVMAPTEDLQEKLYLEMRGRIREDDSTVPEKDGDYFYYIRFEEGGQYPIYCRRSRGPAGADPEGDEEVLLDANELAKERGLPAGGRLRNQPRPQAPRLLSRYRRL